MFENITCPNCNKSGKFRWFTLMNYSYGKDLFINSLKFYSRTGYNNSFVQKCPFCGCFFDEEYRIVLEEDEVKEINEIFISIDDIGG